MSFLHSNKFKYIKNHHWCWSVSSYDWSFRKIQSYDWGGYMIVAGL